VQDVGRRQREPSLIASITGQTMPDYPVDAERVYVAAIGVHSGLALGRRRPPHRIRRHAPGRGRSGAPIGRIPANAPDDCVHADQDSTVHPRNGDQVIAQSVASASWPAHQGSARSGAGGHTYSRTLHADARGQTILEHWVIHGAGLAWSGGSPAGSYTDQQGPDAAREMLRFFLEHRRAQAARPA
jgi:poly(3-hydroxybutyrate) depolymerase